MKNNKHILRPASIFVILLFTVGTILSGCTLLKAEQQSSAHEIIQLGTVPEYSGAAYVIINGNQPQFEDSDITTEAYEYFGELDSLGRCGMTMACAGRELMPTEDRESISHVKPSGWVNIPYDFIDGEYLYNRCHLLGFQLTGENDNEQNLITGTRYMNAEGMLPFENMVADYIKETGNHVMYRVTPIFYGSDLVARGVHMEALSVEDSGDGICFNIYAYNIQPGVTIDYKTGESREGNPNDTWARESDETESLPNAGEQSVYVLNNSSEKFHLPSCSGAESMSDKNREYYTGSRDGIEERGYEPCGQCKP